MTDHPHLAGRAALRMIREAIEEHGPPGILESEEAVTAHRGPELQDEAAALVEAILKIIKAPSEGSAGS